MSDTAKLSPRAAKVMRSVINLLAQGEANWKASAEDREAVREAGTALYLAFFAERDNSGNIVYENPVRRSCRGISPYDPREGSRPCTPPEKIKKTRRCSPPRQRRIDVAVTHKALQDPKNIIKKTK